MICAIKRLPRAVALRDLAYSLVLAAAILSVIFTRSSCVQTAQNAPVAEAMGLPQILREKSRAPRLLMSRRSIDDWWLVYSKANDSKLQVCSRT